MGRTKGDTGPATSGIGVELLGPREVFCALEELLETEFLCLPELKVFEGLAHQHLLKGNLLEALVQLVLFTMTCEAVHFLLP